jgi:hypothetical protein
MSEFALSDLALSAVAEIPRWVVLGFGVSAICACIVAACLTKPDWDALLGFTDHTKL